MAKKLSGLGLLVLIIIIILGSFLITGEPSPKYQQTNTPTPNTENVKVVYPGGKLELPNGYYFQISLAGSQIATNCMLVSENEVRNFKRLVCGEEAFGLSCTDIMVPNDGSYGYPDVAPGVPDLRPQPPTHARWDFVQHLPPTIRGRLDAWQHASGISINYARILRHMILSDSEIKKYIKTKDIIIEPFDESSLGSNSYDVHLSKWLALYKDDILDSRKHNKIEYLEIPDEGFVLEPNTLYLGTILEYTETHKHVPFLEGKSSIGRLGIDIHATAGKGDVGFCGYWTLEISVKQPVRVYKGMPIGQVIFFEVMGEVEIKYNKKKSAKYINQDPKPMESMMFKNKF